MLLFKISYTEKTGYSLDYFTEIFCHSHGKKEFTSNNFFTVRYI